MGKRVAVEKSMLERGRGVELQMRRRVRVSRVAMIDGGSHALAPSWHVAAVALHFGRSLRLIPPSRRTIEFRFCHSFQYADLIILSVVLHYSRFFAIAFLFSLSRPWPPFQSARTSKRQHQDTRCRVKTLTPTLRNGSLSTLLHSGQHTTFS